MNIGQRMVRIRSLYVFNILGEPTEIEPYIVPSKKPGREGQMRKSWIYIMYEKDKLVKKSIDLDK